MADKDDIVVRSITVDDLAELERFFVKAYGAETIFQDDRFINYYFPIQDDAGLCPCIIGTTPAGEIVSHYGLLHSGLMVMNKTYPMAWGVNAYTLPEWRGKGINTKILAHVKRHSEIHGVIGFTREAAAFYDKIGYNLFGYERFDRYIHVLDVEKKPRGEPIHRPRRVPVDVASPLESPRNPSGHERPCPRVV